MGGIFISYRTVDSGIAAVMLDQKLVARFGADAVFRDHRSIELATEFEQVTWSRLRRSDLLLALIGPHWLSESRDGRRLIDDPDDFVRREITEAMRLDIGVLPVLIGDTELPGPDELPGPLRRLSVLQYHRIRVRHPEPDVDELVERLAVRQNHSEPPKATQPAAETAGGAGGGITIMRAKAGRDFIVGDQTNHISGGGT
ncbi:toll/interleukin-1 receptor domain-containing protein [Dactylosporangium matsuzakiense]|uniref:TIR domain-containing protein n=1 Tax=Dactylosporangium matsuzakiense TaxID=53360 RepID=A0A9W6KM34_9ACTN|nr:toll/interleukin-1 receptor domain-containing protein [Dactylosporangium matsuzakiense]UWZ43147.1 toll/interleukin-1 receptor domain-containing protein [Dactylosporangium matsuzakiense]GLL02766.1 hypothetical protein GCM10017581_045080 [Dactylosporangium matsuzakiense]